MNHDNNMITISRDERWYSNSGTIESLCKQVHEQFKLNMYSLYKEITKVVSQKLLYFLAEGVYVN